MRFMFLFLMFYQLYYQYLVNIFDFQFFILNIDRIILKTSLNKPKLKPNKVWPESKFNECQPDLEKAKLAVLGQIGLLRPNLATLDVSRLELYLGILGHHKRLCLHR